ncbi:DNA polymerase IV [Millisia brevis]|uniref:DNA polymerase IV n=1 Tax=Millisia brevis TaxID=264148 RepID=UPI00082C8E21|nr:DNA polymerase IV [Millisia brevis]
MVTTGSDRHPWILHADLDQFQVAVERRRSPELVDRPVIVGGNGDPEERRKVVTCASYEARALGVHAGMPLRRAYLKAPEAVYLPTDGDTYSEASVEVMDTLRAAGHPVEVWGWDEAYIGLLPDAPDPASARAVDLADRLRRAIAALNLSLSVGIGRNKQQAKTATGFAKQAVDHIFVIDDGDWLPLMGDRPARDLWSIGPRTDAKLRGIGVRSVADLLAVEPQRLTEHFGNHQGRWLYTLARGGGDTSIVTEPPEAKSHSKVETFPDDIDDPFVLAQRVDALAGELLDQVVAEGRIVVRVAVTVRTRSFRTRTKSHTLRDRTIDRAALQAAARALLDAFEIDRPVRLLGVRYDLADGSAAGGNDEASGFAAGAGR